MISRQEFDGRTPAPDARTTVITLRTPTSASMLGDVGAFSPTRISAPCSSGDGAGARDPVQPFGPEESCGIVAVAAPHNVPSRVFTVLRALQHRGQEGGGIATHDGSQVQKQRGDGLITEIITKEKREGFTGDLGVGHVRYSTTGGTGAINLQPIVGDTDRLGEIALAHNGDIVNSAQLREKYLALGEKFHTTADTEVVLRILQRHIDGNGGDMINAIESTMNEICGAYSLVIITREAVYAVRDPYAVKPLCFGRFKDGGFIASSESCGLDAVEATLNRELRPGEILRMTPTHITSHFTSTATHGARCMFEWVYFARPDSIIDTISVYHVRMKIGKKLWDEREVGADMTIPIPDSGRAHALGFSRNSAIVYVEGLIKNRYVQRTFILPHQADRAEALKVKVNPIAALIRDKRVVLVDDSIVRGNTMRRIVKMVRDVGADEIHVRLGCPPIIAPCYFGIDMKTREQFIAKPGETHEEVCRKVAEHIGADSVHYITVDGLVECIGLPRSELCLGCITAEYPMEIPGERIREEEDKRSKTA